LCFPNVPTCSYPVAEAETHPGFSAAEYDDLGLDKAKLKKLERLGFALRGYTKNVWLDGDKLA
jgi:hypothetical protein